MANRARVAGQKRALSHPACIPFPALGPAGQNPRSSEADQHLPRHLRAGAQQPATRRRSLRQSKATSVSLVEPSRFSGSSH